MSSITASTSGPIVKSDRSGRTRYTAQYKQQVLEAFASSSLSAPTFAKQCGIKYPTFAAGISSPKCSHREPSTGRPTFLIAEVSTASDGPALEIHLPGGAVARASDASQIRLLSELLRHPA